MQFCFPPRSTVNRGITVYSYDVNAVDTSIIIYNVEHYQFCLFYFVLFYD